MFTQPNVATRGMLVLILMALTAPSWADRDRYERRGGPDFNFQNNAQAQDQRRLRPDAGDRRDDARERRANDRYQRSPVIRNQRGYALDQRYRHNRYYPSRGTEFRVLPREHREVFYRGTRYYFHGGVWYRHRDSRYIVVHPPIGLYVSILPPYYTTIWVRGEPYFYAAGVYYTWLPERNVYVVSTPPSDENISQPPGDSDELFIYPKQGQSEEKQATDRYQCYDWAKSQTGFDPTVPGGNVSDAEHDRKRSDYHRAMKACLEARGYSVQ